MTATIVTYPATERGMLVARCIRLLENSSEALDTAHMRVRAEFDKAHKLGCETTISLDLARIERQAEYSRDARLRDGIQRLLNTRDGV